MAISKTNILLILGASGSGKTAIRDLLLKNEGSYLIHKSFVKPVQMTTRPKREFENYTDYLFVDKEYFNKSLENYELTAVVNNFNSNCYGTLKNTIISGDDIINTIVVNKEGMKSVFDTYSGVSNVKIKTMLVLSNFDEDIINSHNNRSLDSVKEELFDLINYGNYDYYVGNSCQHRVKYYSLIDIFKRSPF